ncbi:MAG: multiheme c-type cytochrome [Candidatus Acidiferrum sp.]
MNFKPRLVVIVTLLLAAEVASQNRSPQTNPAPTQAIPPQPTSSANAKLNSRANYVGDEACRSCHQDKVETFHRTAHYLTSRLPDKDAILGSFNVDANVLKTSNPDLYFRMEARDGSFFQTAVQGQPPYTTSRTERFGLVVGSGGKGQTFLFWKGDLLFQLPVSYWKEAGWVNSPGYRDGVAYFDRPVIPRCLECHGTYFESLAPLQNRYSQTGFVVGITCEKCHGPGQTHIRRFSSKSVETSSDPAILNPARFSRDRQMDLCAWCHAGHGVPLLATFSYIPGEPLDKYVELPQPDPNAPVDVHGSQVELLKKSRCFQSSTMTCLTCHDVHTTQKDPAAFSGHCLNCHKVETHPKIGQPIANNCVDCHMPKRQTNLIVFNWNGRKVSPEVRNHWIKVYPETSAPKPGEQDEKP